jgi:hypothetical protein
MITNETLPALPGFRLTGPCMSRLLGIPLIEYYNLNHGLLEEINDGYGATIYRMKIDEDNDPVILKKLKTDKNLMLHLTEAEVNAVRAMVF